MIPLVGAAEMRALDTATIEHGLPAFTLMEVAGRGVADHLLAALPALRRAAVVCGSGGNGGDGFVAARLLADRGVTATVYLAAAPPADSAAGQHLALYRSCGGRVVELGTAEQLAAASPELAAAEVVLDALFGVGLSRPVTGHFAQVIAAINAAPRRWSIDLPSGLDADRGQVLGACVHAEATVSLGLHKLGAVTSPGFVHAGQLHLVDLGFPRLVTGEPGELVLVGRAVGWLEEQDARALVPAAGPLDHKGRRGHVLVVGGAPGMRGAAELASAAAMRVGAGLCTWAAPDEPPVSQQPSLMTRGLGDFDPEIVRVPRIFAPPPVSDPFSDLMARSGGAPDHGAADEDEEEVFSPAHHALARLSELAADKAALCLGPGLGRAAAAVILERWYAARGTFLSSLLPVVLDADALFALADYTAVLPGRAVITPHPKEAARLLDLTTGEVEADRLAAARRLSERFGCVAVLKGARTIICEGPRAWLCSAGSPALATAGSGDVLAGAIAGLCAQGLSPRDAALLGVWLHGRAGTTLGERLGPRGVLSSDLPAQLGLELAALSR